LHVTVPRVGGLVTLAAGVTGGDAGDLTVGDFVTVGDTTVGDFVTVGDTTGDATGALVGEFVTGVVTGDDPEDEYEQPSALGLASHGRGEVPTFEPAAS
jgi:hypothetical protein